MYDALREYHERKARQFGAAVRAHLLLALHHPRPAPGLPEAWTRGAYDAARLAAHHARMARQISPFTPHP